VSQAHQAARVTWGRNSDEEAVWCSSRCLAVRSYSLDPPGLGSATAYPDVGATPLPGSGAALSSRATILTSLYAATPLR
jgi:hypothetical protein